jgi:hypothetical protein
MLPTSNIRLPGGRSRRPYRGMATIRDKLGHWSSADPGHGGQDQFALTSERHLNGSHSGEPRSPGIGHETGPSALSTASPPHDRASREANRVRDRRRRAKPIPVVSRGGEGGIGSVLALRRRPDRCLARRWGVGRSQRMAQFAANRCHTPGARSPFFVPLLLDTLFNRYRTPPAGVVLGLWVDRPPGAISGPPTNQG